MVMVIGGGGPGNYGKPPQNTDQDTKEGIQQRATSFTEQPPPSPGVRISYSGAGASDPRHSGVFDHFAYWCGEDWALAHMDIITRAHNERWTEDDIRRFVMNQGLTGPGVEAAWQYVRRETASRGWRPDAGTVAAIIASGVYMTQGWDAYCWSQASIDWNPETNPAIAWAREYWDRYVGPDVPISAEATAELARIVRQYGNTDLARTAYANYLKSTPAAKNGRYGQTTKSTVIGIFQQWFGRDPTDAELQQYLPYAEDPEALKDILRRHPEYKTTFVGKPEWMSEEEYVARCDGLNLAMARRYGYPVTPGAAEYVGAEGKQPRTSGRWQYITPEEREACIRLGLTGADIDRETGYLNDVDYMDETLNPILEETLGRRFTRDELYIVASGALGSGHLRALITEAKNRYEFKEAFWYVYGRYPTAQEYEIITSQYVSPSQLIAETNARNKAQQMYPEVSELLRRVYGINISLGDLTDYALGRANTGWLGALISKAEELDQYTWIHKQYYGKDPTPEDYAKYEGYTGPDQLVWEITLNESLAELGPQIIEDFKIGLGEDISEDELRIMLGKQEGYGELRRRWSEAKERRQQLETAEQRAQFAEKAEVLYTKAPQGGIKEAVPGLATI